MKTLASQALIAKNQSGNITQGGITDNVTIAALNTMNNVSQGILEQAESETEALRARVDDAYSVFLNATLACDVQVEPFNASYESNHDVCRASLKEIFFADRDSYEAAVRQVRTTSGCVTKFVSNCSAWDAEFFAPWNYPNLKTLSLRKAVVRYSKNHGLIFVATCFGSS